MRRRAGGRSAAEDGAVGLALVAVAALAAVAVAVAVTTVASVLAATARAQHAADAAALAAASASVSPGLVAAHVAHANGARLVACRCGAGTAGVTAIADVRSPLARAFGVVTVTATAEAALVLPRAAGPVAPRRPTGPCAGRPDGHGMGCSPRARSRDLSYAART